MCRFKVGSTFDSYEELDTALKKYCEENYVCFYKREARTVSAAVHKTGRFVNSNLKYYQLKYACIKGGKTFKTASKGQRNTSTYKSGCNAHITLRATRSGQKLEIVSMLNDHNHEATQKLFSRLPQQRRLSRYVQSENRQLSKLRTNKRHLKLFLENKSGNIILLEDIHNITSKTHASDDASNLQHCIQELQETYKTDCHVLADEKNQFKALLFQSHQMKQYMAAYPDFLCINNTFKLLDIRTPIFLIINEDGNGLTEIVAVAILIEENAETIQWFFSKFKETNPQWTQVNSIMADKDLDVRRLLKVNFPNADIVNCIFNVMRIFDRKISSEKLGITLDQRQTAIEILQKMVYCKDSDTYELLYGEFLKSCPITIVEYFNHYWHNIKDEWTVGPNLRRSNFINAINNRLESLNSKIKSVVERYSTLANFIDDFFELILIMNDERDHEAADLMYKVPISFYKNDSALDKYFKYLTIYAFDFIKKEFEGIGTIENLDYDTTIQSCTCELHTSMVLPCCHILKKRQETGIDLYEESLCHVRWTRKHYYNNQRLLAPVQEETYESEETKPTSILSRSEIKLPAELNQHQKFSEAFLLLQSLATLISEEENNKFHFKMRQLMQLRTAWVHGRDVEIIENSGGTTDSKVPNTESLELAINNTLEVQVSTETKNIVNIHPDASANCMLHIEDNASSDHVINETIGPGRKPAITVSDCAEKELISETETMTDFCDTANIVIMPASRKVRGRPKRCNSSVSGKSTKKKNKL